MEPNDIDQGAPQNIPCPYCGSTAGKTPHGEQVRCNECGNSFTPTGEIVHVSMPARTEAASTPVIAPAATTELHCPECCAPAGQPHRAGCTQAGLASAVRKAIDILAGAVAAAPNGPLAVPAALGILRSGLDAEQHAADADPWTDATSPPDDDLLVLLELADGEVWPGFRDSGIWRYVTAEPIESTTVTGWMHMPAGRIPAAANTATSAGRVDRVGSAVHDVLAERRRQVDQEGYDPEHDDAHPNGEIAAYAAFYAMPPAARDWPATETGYGDTFGEAIVPADWTVPKTGDRRSELVKAGALILAEIERLDRATAPATNQGGSPQ